MTHPCPVRPTAPNNPHVDPNCKPPYLQCPPGGEFGEGEDGGHPACSHPALSWRWQPQWGPSVDRRSQEPSPAPAQPAPAPFVLFLWGATGLGGTGDKGGCWSWGEEEKGWKGLRRRDRGGEYWLAKAHQGKGNKNPKSINPN